MKPEKIGHYGERDLDLFLLDVSSIKDIPEDLSIPSRHFIVLIVCDCRTVADSDISSAMSKLLRNGACYFHGWGKGATRIDDHADLVCIDAGIGVNNGDFIGTSWTDNEPIEEGIWFALGVAYPSDSYWDDCKSLLAVVVQDEASSSKIKEAFRNPEQFIEQYVNQEP